MSRLYFLLVFMFLLCSISYTAELPLAMYTTRDDLVLQDTLALRDTLGINFIYGAVDYSAIGPLKAAGFGLIKWGGTGYNDVNYYSGKSYFKAAANDFSSFPRFTIHRGDSSGGFWTNDSSGVKLSGPIIDGLWFCQYDRSGFGGEGPREFYSQIRMAIDPTNMTSDSLIGTIYIHLFNGSTWQVRDSILVYPDNALLAGDTIYAPLNPLSFTLGEGGCLLTNRTKYSFSASGKMKVYLDSLKCYDAVGRSIVEDTLYNRAIADSVINPPYSDIDYWWLRDEPKYDYFMPWRKVRDVLNGAARAPKAIGAFIADVIHANWNPGEIDSTLMAISKLTYQDKIIINDYPFGGGYGSSYFTDYTGYGDSVGEPGGHRGLQLALERTSQLYMDAVRKEIGRHDSLKEVWYSPQWFWSDCGGGGEPPTTEYIWRPPTPSELRMQIYWGLCYGVKGINIWRYDYGSTADYCDSNCWQGSFYDSLPGEPPSRDSLFWQAMRDDINPYIKAIDSVYMGLTWERAYPYHPIYHSNDLPPGAFVSSISAISNSPDSNPDLGWFQVGEFDSSGDKYIMLVNRACSQGQWNSAEAPSITATVKFNPTNLNLRDYIYVIDIARSETTYSAKMPDGKIPYTITLKAGEGKLIKIAQ